MQYFGETAFEFGSATLDWKQDIFEQIFSFTIFSTNIVPERLD